MESIKAASWFLCMLLLLLFTRRWMHREIQLFLLVITRRPLLTIGIFSILLFPGILLHETSHLITAKLLGVRTGSLSLIPKILPGSRVQMGFVETEKTDIIRSSLIGIAPLITGGSVVAFLGIFLLGLKPVFQAMTLGMNIETGGLLQQVVNQPDFWLWFYIAFSVSSTMFPSESDRRSWFPVIILISAIFLLVLVAGAGPWLASRLAPLIQIVLLSIAAVFFISLITHIIVAIPFSLSRHLLSRLTGYYPV